MKWFICKMSWHMCIFALENLTVKGLKGQCVDIVYSSEAI